MRNFFILAACCLALYFIGVPIVWRLLSETGRLGREVATWLLHHVEETHVATHDVRDGGVNNQN